MDEIDDEVLEVMENSDLGEDTAERVAGVMSEQRKKKLQQLFIAALQEAKDEEDAVELEELGI